MKFKEERIFKTAPLPFQGQKRRFTGAFALALQELKAKKEVKVIVDLFGGSGLLSHTAKRLFPDCRVIYNDFDNYNKRLRNIENTNRLLADIRLIIGDCPKDQKISKDLKNELLKRIEHEEKRGYVDYITLSSSLLFSGKYVVSYDELSKKDFYNSVKVSDYDCDPDEYLKDLDIVSIDYKELYQQYKDVPGVLFIVDPPYLCTDTKTYQSDKYWKLRDYLDVLNVLVGYNYVFFTSNKSSLIELCEWFEENRHIGNPFKNSVLNAQNVTINGSKNSKAGYTDMMLYKFVK